MIVSELHVYACLTCGVTEQSLTQLRWHEGQGHVVDRMQLKRRDRKPRDVQWSTEWRRL